MSDPEKFHIELDREEDGRWIAEIPAIPGALAYGCTEEEAKARVEAVALRAIADRIEEQCKAVPAVMFA